MKKIPSIYHIKIISSVYPSVDFFPLVFTAELIKKKTNIGNQEKKFVEHH